MFRTIEVSAPSRLHFGLFSFGGAGRQFGGVGVMVDRPQLQLRLEPAERFEADGPGAERVAEFARRWTEFHRLSVAPAVRCAVLSAPAEHAGLGSGTQLGLSVAAGLAAACQLPQQSPVELAVSVGRGLRSAVGTYGFAGGGLIVERGKTSDDAISPLECRLDLPTDWRFVLAMPTGQRGVSGAEEQQAFSTLPQVAPAVSASLIAEVREHLLPAAARGDFERFSESLYRYGHDAGMCFATKQGGPYNGPVLTSLVQLIRSLGVVGVGQSSWGPTIFAVLPTPAAAEQFVGQLRARWSAAADLQITVAPPNNTGATVRIVGNSANP